MKDIHLGSRLRSGAQATSFIKQRVGHAKHQQFQQMSCHRILFSGLALQEALLAMSAVLPYADAAVQSGKVQTGGAPVAFGP